MTNPWNDMRTSGRGGFGPGALSPFIKAMLIANTGLFLLQLVWPDLTIIAGLSPARFFSQFPNLLYQPFTYMFLHGGFMHLFFNMFVLWMFGTEIEFTWGTKAFAKFYLLAGLSGALLAMLVNSGQMSVVIGASAAIYGVFIAYWLMYPNRSIYLYFLIPVKVKWFVPGFMLVGFLFGGAGISHMAHLGGAIFGLIYLKSKWRFGKIAKPLHNFKAARQEAKFEKNRVDAETTMKKIDAILDKINEVGIENLSKSERKFLDDASSKMSRKEMKD